MCPDFLFFHSDSEKTKVSIVDPHGHHLADALPKLLGLAEFAATHRESFHRIESVARMNDGTLRVLDLTDPPTREAIAKAGDTKASTAVTRLLTTSRMDRGITRPNASRSALGFGSVVCGPVVALRMTGQSSLIPLRPRRTKEIRFVLVETMVGTAPLLNP